MYGLSPCHMYCIASIILCFIFCTDLLTLKSDTALLGYLISIKSSFERKKNLLNSEQGLLKQLYTVLDVYD